MRLYLLDSMEKLKPRIVSFHPVTTQKPPRTPVLSGIPLKFRVTCNFLLRAALRIVYHGQCLFVDKTNIKKQPELKAGSREGTGLEKQWRLEYRCHAQHSPAYELLCNRVKGWVSTARTSWGLSLRPSRCHPSRRHHKNQVCHGCVSFQTDSIHDTRRSLERVLLCNLARAVFTHTPTF